MIDKNFCMSSYLAFRYIEDDSKTFDGVASEQFVPVTNKVSIKDCDELDKCIETQIAILKNKYNKLGIMLSGGMDSAIVASYMSGCDAYTFRYLGGDFAKDELERAEKYAKQFGLNLHYVDIDFDKIMSVVDECMVSKHAPVHSIEPQILLAARQAKNDGVDCILVGESADLIYGGMDQLLSKDWTIEEFSNRYTFLDPKMVLKEPVDMSYLFDRFNKDGKFDFLSFMDSVFSIESSSSYLNAFKIAGIDYYDPYAMTVMSEPLNLERIRNGEPKYIVRELFEKRYGYKPHKKTPMPRPVDEYFKSWPGPTRSEFREDIDMSLLTGNQKWQLWCLERYLCNIL